MQVIRTTSEISVHGFMTPYSGAEEAGVKGPLAADMDTVLLLHMDGDDDGTTFADSSLGGDDSPHTVTPTNAVTKTGQKQFGTASAYFDGSGDYLGVTASSDFNFADGNFTIECWVRFAALTGEHQIVNFNRDDESCLQLYVGSDKKIGFWNPDLSFGGGSALSTDTWYHVALVRNGTAWNLYIDGTSQASTTSSLTMPSLTTPLHIGAGAYSGGGMAWYTNGYIDEVRISKGVARYTGNFTPPTVPFNS